MPALSYPDCSFYGEKAYVCAYVEENTSFGKIGRHGLPDLGLPRTGPQDRHHDQIARIEEEADAGLNFDTSRPKNAEPARDRRQFFYFPSLALHRPVFLALLLKPKVRTYGCWTIDVREAPNQNRDGQE